MQIAAQQRTVTLDDYMVRALSMPSDFGTVSKIYIEKPTLGNQISSLETLCMYVLSLNSSNQFSTATPTLKKNLRTYLSQYKMIGDSIEIKDAYIINIAIDFEIVVLPNFINSQVIYPSLDPSIFEIKYPNQDIKGRVVPL